MKLKLQQPVFRKKRDLPTSLDGFRANQTISFLSDQPNLFTNEWSIGKKLTVPVLDFYINPGEVVWKGQTVKVADYGFFKMLIKSWINGVKTAPFEMPKTMTKEQALDQFFEMSKYGEQYAT